MDETVSCPDGIDRLALPVLIAAMMDTIITSILSAFPAPAVLISADGRIAAMNDSAVELLGTQGTGRNYQTIMRQPPLLDAIDSALRGAGAGRTRFIDNSPTREAAFRVLVAPCAGATESGVLVTFEDITEVERADRMRRDFVANVSHELKTPLTSLLGFIETLRGAARDDPTARERFLGIMEREAERMNRLVADLLSLSRVESAERQRPRDSIDMGDLVHATAVVLRPMAEAAGVKLEIDQAEDDPLVVLGDEDQLQQVLANLMENAVKYGGAGGKVTVRIARVGRELAFRGPAVEIEVRDYGEGFDPIHIPRITERFYRVDTHRSREKGGTGLGLAIAKHIINRHRGRLRIESTPGQGAQFTVLLPAR